MAKCYKCKREICYCNRPSHQPQEKQRPLPETLPDTVAFVSITPKRLAELEAKAAKWDTISPKIQYLSDFFEDLKTGKQ